MFDWIFQLFNQLVMFLQSLPATFVNFLVSVGNTFANAFFAMLTAMVSTLPAHTPLGLSLPDGWLKGYSLLNTFLPLNEALTFAGIMVVVYGAAITWRLIVVIYHLIPKPFVGT